VGLDEPMHRSDAWLRVPGTDDHRHVIRWGHWGRPLLVFPSEAGAAEDFASNGMLDAIHDLVAAGRVSVFCVDSLDAWSWSDNSLPTETRAERHGYYHRWLTDAVVPWIHGELGGPADLITTGVSLGAYHAVQFALTRADLAPLAIGLSGAYDPTQWNGWGETGDATYFANPCAYVPGLHGDHLDWLRSRVGILLVVGEGPFEVHPTKSLPSTRHLAHLLGERGIPHELDVWGHDSAHDWPWWRKQLAHHLPRFV
jgi:esterase/lipase superfamily enzyme